MGLLIAALGGYGLYVLQAAGGFVVELYDRPLMAINYDRAASLGFAEMDKEQLRQAAAATDRERAAIEAKIKHLAKVFNDDLAVAAARSLYDDEKAAIGQIHDLVARWNELRLVPGKTAANDLSALAAGIMERFDLLAELATGHSFVLRRKVVSDVAFFEYTSAAALILALLLAGGITVMLVRRIVRPLRDAAAIADRIAEGELQAPIPEGVRDETGLLLRSMTVMQQNIRDMVEREQAQRRSAQNRLVEALENSREAVVLVDAEDRIVIANSRLADFFPTVAPQLAAGMSFTEAFHQVEQLAGPPTADAVSAAAADSPSSERELRLADGRWLRISRSPLQEGGFFLVISDFSDVKEREQRLTEARRQAEAASAAKSTFLANMSHELRTPLNAIIGFSDVMANEVMGELNPSYVQYAHDIRQSGGHLLDIISSVLDLSKSEAGKLTLTYSTVDLSEIIKASVTMMRDQCSRAKLTLFAVLPPDPIEVQGDPAKLRQVVLNLLSNAAKFTDSGGTITVSAASTGGASVIRVSDNGIGMSSDEIPIALSAFGQIDNRLARRYEGTGLGLPLSKAIVELHGGTVTIDSAPGKGTNVTVTLPREAAAAGAAAA
jgi:signal transduction histidine kinase/HAMP domain-containing protein